MTAHDAGDNDPIRLDGDFAIATRDRAHLVDSTVAALATLLGDAPEIDEDGDIAIPVHGFGLFVTVADDGPQLHVWSSLLGGIENRELALARMLDLSAEWPRLRFTFQDGHLLVSTIVDADPFTPQHLVNIVDEFHDLTHELDDDFAARFGGTLDCDADDESYAGPCGGCGPDCACGHGDELGETIPVGRPDA